MLPKKPTPTVLPTFLEPSTRTFTEPLHPETTSDAVAAIADLINPPPGGSVACSNGTVAQPVATSIEKTTRVLKAVRVRERLLKLQVGDGGGGAAPCTLAGHGATPVHRAGIALSATVDAQQKCPLEVANNFGTRTLACAHVTELISPASVDAEANQHCAPVVGHQGNRATRSVASTVHVAGTAEPPVDTAALKVVGPQRDMQSDRFAIEFSLSRKKSKSVAMAALPVVGDTQCKARYIGIGRGATVALQKVKFDPLTGSPLDQGVGVHTFDAGASIVLENKARLQNGQRTSTAVHGSAAGGGDAALLLSGVEPAARPPVGSAVSNCCTQSNEMTHILVSADEGDEGELFFD